jgi:hypothetical protein
MRRVVARLPGSVSELCLVRFGLQARGIPAWLWARRMRGEIVRASAQAIASDSGLLRADPFSVGRGHWGILQYWNGYEALDAWSHRPPHAEWWRAAVDRMRRRGDVGVYHEAYLVGGDQLESIYLDCAPTGLAAFGDLAEPVGPLTNARSRLGRARNPA